MTDPQLADILKELKNHSTELSAIKSGLETQNSFSSTFWLHFVDFFVIMVADIFAAGFVLITFESLSERDRSHTERAERILGKLNPHMEPLVLFLSQRATNHSGVSFSTPWSSSSSVMNKDLGDSYLIPGSLDWDYPGGKDLFESFTKLKAGMKDIGGTIGDGSPKAASLAAQAKDVQEICIKQIKRYSSGGTWQTWRRFFHGNNI